MKAIRREAPAVLIDRLGFDRDQLLRRQLDFPAGVQILCAFALARRIQIEVGDGWLVAATTTQLGCCGTIGGGGGPPMRDGR